MQDAGTTIRTLRAQSNTAIAARDADRVIAFMAPDITVAVAGGPVLRGVDASRSAFAEQFADPTFLGYERSPADVVVLPGGARVAERGQWVGRWRSARGEHVQRGGYTAEWSLGPLGWHITQETYLP
jgi:ketosteroid isomerase-like protein